MDLVLDLHHSRKTLGNFSINSRSVIRHMGKNLADILHMRPGKRREQPAVAPS